MKDNSCSLRFKIVVFTLTAAIVIFAFVHSSMPSVQSAQESGNVLGFLQYIFGFFGLGDNLDDHIVRKAAHFIEYSALGIMLVFCAYSFNRSKPFRYSLHIAAAGIFTALIDETIQLNVPGRAGMVTDIWLDFSGVFTGSVVMLIIFAIYLRVRTRNNE